MGLSSCISILLLSMQQGVNAFYSTTTALIPNIKTKPLIVLGSSTTTAPPRTDRKTSKRASEEERRRKGLGLDEWLVSVEDKLEYLADDKSISRLADDPFHIILLGSETFNNEKTKSRITIPYVASSLEYVLGMSTDVALDHTTFAKENGLSCLGTWKREECLLLGSQLLVRDVICRVVPYCHGAGGSGSGWQARDISNDSSSSSSSYPSSFGFQ